MKKILIIEDESAYQNILKDQLARTDFEMLAAKNGKEGLEIALKEHPDVILLDIVMPVMDGITMLDELRKDETYGATAKVIILTNLDIDSGIRDKTNEEHHSYYRVKSDIKMAELLELINNLLNGENIPISQEETPSDVSNTMTTPEVSQKPKNTMVQENEDAEAA